MEFYEILSRTCRTREEANILPSIQSFQISNQAPNFRPLAQNQIQQVLNPMYIQQQQIQQQRPQDLNQMQYRNIPQNNVNLQGFHACHPSNQMNSTIRTMLSNTNVNGIKFFFFLIMLSYNRCFN